MSKVIVKEIYRITEDPMVIGDVDKLVIIYQQDGVQEKTIVPWQEFKNKAEFKKVLKDAINQKREPKKIINLAKDWKGEYNI